MTATELADKIENLVCITQPDGPLYLSVTLMVSQTVRVDRVNPRLETWREALGDMILNDPEAFGIESTTDGVNARD